jgi:hypothetical protein
MSSMTQSSTDALTALRSEIGEALPQCLPDEDTLLHQSDISKVKAYVSFALEIGSVEKDHPFHPYWIWAYFRRSGTKAISSSAEGGISRLGRSLCSF